MGRTASLRAGRTFIRAEARLLERHLAAVLFEGADAAQTLRALSGYRNDDGGFGHGLEPDKRVPESQPLDVEAAFAVLETVGVVDEELVRGACDFLARLGAGVGCLTPEALEHPRAAHWGTWAVAPSLNPTAGLVARLWAWGIEHPWRDRATSFCLEQLAAGLPDDAHAFGEVLDLLEAHPQARQAVSPIELRRHLGALRLFHLEPNATDYGLTPLHFAPRPDSRWAELFEPETIEGHLEALAAAQQPDGGWPISWESIGPAAVTEWRGIETLRALRTLAAYGRLLD